MSPSDKLKAEFYTEEEVAVALRLAIKTMRTYRSEGKDHPPSIKMGRVTLYPKKDYDAWIAKRQKCVPVT